MGNAVQPTNEETKVQHFELMTTEHAIATLWAMNDMSDREKAMRRMIEDLADRANPDMEKIMDDNDLSSEDVGNLASAIICNVDTTIALLNILNNADITEADQLTRLVELPQKIIEAANSVTS